ncbi:MAG: hypothetical protein EBT70_13810 [Betaproteobacteria bacterium]|nr:hypothetical protein [Betaproteobacteria bacterium]
MEKDQLQNLNTGEAFLRLLASRDVDFFFVNSGTDFPALVEALAQAKSQGFAVPKTLLVPHENVAVGMAFETGAPVRRMHTSTASAWLGTRPAWADTHCTWVKPLPPWVICA